jgi:hypothetical protein
MLAVAGATTRRDASLAKATWEILSEDLSSKKSIRTFLPVRAAKSRGDMNREAFLVMIT